MLVKETFLNISSKKAYVRIFEESKEAPNIIYIMTPIVTVKDPLAESFMDGLIGNGCNVFALDFLGIGSSEGTASDINFTVMKSTIIELIEYIQENYSANIHFYGATGTGGILGQALCSDVEIGNNICSFIQYGVGKYDDLSTIGNTKVLKLIYPFVSFLGRRFPSRRVKFKIPDYDGFNAEKEGEWYKNVMEVHPKAFDVQFSLLSLVLELHIASGSSMRITPKCPVLVLAAQYDRYFTNEYIESYYKSLNVKKNIIWYEDSHLAFDWRSEEINNDVIAWIRENTK